MAILPPPFQVEKEEVNEIRRTELALAPDSMEGLYFATLRGGMCSSYLAASVIASDMVATSKTGATGTVCRHICASEVLLQRLDENRVHMRC